MRTLNRCAAGLLWCALSGIAAGQTSEVVHSFAASSGSALSLVEGTGGKLFGVSVSGGPAGWGEIYSLTPDGVGGFDYQTLYAFTGDVHGKFPWSGLVRGDDGFYGTTSLGGAIDHGTVYRIDESGFFETVAEFTNAQGPIALMLADDGNFYGITGSGGDFGYGTVFRMDGDGSGTITIVRSFTQFAKPVGNLVQGTDAALYGAFDSFTLNGGPGGLFRLSLAGEYTEVHSFSGSDGENPVGLVRASDGTIYGTTSAGGLSSAGTIFRIDSNGVFSMLYQASGGDGTLQSVLTEGDDGKLYGSSSAGAHGAVYRYDPAGTLEILAYVSDSGAEGHIVATWVLANDGDFYGAAPYGGSGYGTVVRFDGASFESVHVFEAFDGWLPQNGLVDGGDGWLYGTTTAGAGFTLGSVFRLNTAGAYDTFHSFTQDEGIFGTLASSLL
jgi:uncharacterized repeat protein (TIGR03803 family)